MGARTRRLAIAAVAAGYLLLLAHSVARSGDSGTWHVPLSVIVLLVLPPAIFAAARAPFPTLFGAYVALIPFDPILSITGGVTIVRLIGAAAIAAMLARVMVRRVAFRPPPAWWYWLAFISWAGLTFMWTNDPAASGRIYPILLQNFAMMTALAVYPVTRREFAIMATTTVASAVAAVLIAVKMNGGLQDGARLSITTTNGLQIDQNVFATSFLLPLAFAFGGIQSTRNRWLHLAGWFAMGTLLFAILTSGSRGATVAALMMLGYTIVRTGDWRKLCALGVAGALIVARYPVVLMRFLHDDGGGTGSGRTLIWQVGLNALHGNWLFGSGIGSFEETYARLFLGTFQKVNQGWHRPAHNVLLGMSVEVGIVGIVALLAAWYLSFRSMRDIPRESPYFVWRVACEGALIGFAVQSLFIDAMWLKEVWLGLSLPYLLRNLYEPRPFGVRSVAWRAFTPRPGPVRA